MRNEERVGTRRTMALPGLLLVVAAFAIALASGARAHDPPIVSVGSVEAVDNTASGSVASGGQTDACVNDGSSTADPSATNGPVQLDTGSCAGAEGSPASAGGSLAATGSTGSKAGASGGKSSATTAAVSSSDAIGLRIARVRHLTNGVAVTKRFRVLVTLRDMRGKYVRGAIVSVSRVPGAASTTSGVSSAFSNKSGQATIVVPVTESMLGKRLFLKIGARTASARAIAVRSLRLPALA
jgi:hypothetical protein